VVVMAGSRAGGFEVVYPVNEVAAKHGANALEETSRPEEATARWGPEERSAYRPACCRISARRREQRPAAVTTGRRASASALPER